MQPALDGAGSDVEHLGHVGLAHLLEPAQSDDGAIVDGEPAEGVDQRRTRLVANDRILVRREVDPDGPSAADEPEMAYRGADLVLRGVGDDAEQPWAEGTGRVEPGERPVGSQETLLGRVDRRRRAGDGRGEANRGALVPTDELLESPIVTLLGPADPGLVVQSTSCDSYVVAALHAENRLGSGFGRSLATGSV